MARINIGNIARAGKDAPETDPHLGLQFWVEIDGIEIAGFSECSGLQVETETFEYAEGGLQDYTHKLPVRTKYGNITLKRGLDPGQDLYTWFLRSVKTLAVGTGRDEDENPRKRGILRKNISIIVYNAACTKVVQKWDLRDAFPVKWTGPDLKADAGAIAVETLEFAHHGLIFDNVRSSNSRYPSFGSTTN